MKIGLVGNQNCGKTTLFNLLTGSSQKVGNWAGVTVEKKEGIIKGTNYKLVDLPGIYSLFPYSEEEVVATNCLKNKEIDLIINVIDSVSIERSLYLTTQLMDLNIPLVIVLNMIDLADRKGVIIDEKKLSKELGVKVIKVSSLKNLGVEELICSLKENNSYLSIKIFSEEIENKISYLSNEFKDNKRFNSISKLEEEEENSSVIVNQRYKYISEIKRKCVKEKENKESISNKLDKVLLNKWLALPIFAFIMFFVYFIATNNSYLSDLVSECFNYLGEKIIYVLNRIHVSRWLISLVKDGIMVGVNSILRFIPQLAILFICISLLECSGYMARIALFLDRIFKKFGLSGKTLIPFIVGSGCSVPGIMSTRIIENKEEREMGIILTPFIPCSAKLPIISLFASYFFTSKQGLISASFYFLSILLIFIVSLILKKFIYKKDNDVFISELVEYKLPSFKYVYKDVSQKVASFIKRAGSIILISSIGVWVLLSFSFKLEYGVSIENSILAHIGKSVSWAFYPFLHELSWEASVSAIQGLIAKEQVVSSLSIIASKSSNSLFSSPSPFAFFNSVSAYSFVAFNLFSAPCFGAIGAMKKELKSTRKTLLASFLQITVAWIIAFVIYLVGTLIVGNI